MVDDRYDTGDPAGSGGPGADEPEDRHRGRVVSEMVKRLFVAGMGALFTSEEGIRRLATEFSLPKDVASYLISQGRSTKNELFRIMAREFREFLNSINLGNEITKALTSLTFEVKMQIRLLPSDRAGAVRPDVKGDVKVHKAERSRDRFWDRNRDRDRDNDQKQDDDLTQDNDRPMDHDEDSAHDES